MTVAKVYNGATWDSGLMKVWNGTGWEPYGKFYNGTVFVPLYPSADPTVNIQNDTFTDIGLVRTAIAGIRWNSDGTVDGYENGYASAGWNWISPTSAAPSDYQVSYTQTGDTIDSGTPGAWYNMSASPAFTLTQAGPTNASKTAVLTFSVRKGTGSVLDTCVITLTATYNDGA